MTVVLVTHEHDIADFASRVIGFRDGHVVDDRRDARPSTRMRKLRELEPSVDAEARRHDAGSPASASRCARCA